MSNYSTKPKVIFRIDIEEGTPISWKPNVEKWDLTLPKLPDWYRTMALRYGMPLDLTGVEKHEKKRSKIYLRL